MKKKINIALIIIFMLLMILTTIVKATEVSASLSPNKQKVEQSAEVKISIVMNNFTREGNQKAVETKIQYDNQKLEYKGIEWKNGWTGSISTDGTGMAASKSGQLITQETVAEITYLVKENAEKGNTTITAKEIITSSDGDEVQADDTQTTIEIIEKGEGESTEKELSSIEVTTYPTKTNYTKGEKFDTTGMIVIAKYSDGSSKEITGYTYAPTEELKISDKEITITYTEGNITKTAKIGITVTTGTNDNNGDSSGGTNDNNGDSTGGTDSSSESNEKKEESTSGGKTDSTQSDKEYPKTGAKTFILPIAIIAIFGIISYTRYKRYKEI